jgi:hypothetical protein
VVKRNGEIKVTILSPKVIFSPPLIVWAAEYGGCREQGYRQQFKSQGQLNTCSKNNFPLHD